MNGAMTSMAIGFGVPSGRPISFQSRIAVPAELSCATMGWQVSV